MPRLWTETIETHRREVRDAIVDTTMAVVAERGLLGVTMSEIAQETGIGRATLYKYFGDVESVLRAWHERQIERHLNQLAEVSRRTEGAMERLEATLDAYAGIVHGSRGHRDTELAAILHRDAHVGRAQRHVLEMFRDLVAEAAERGDVRADVAPSELASFCVHALAAAGTLPSRAATRRLVEVTLAALRPQA